MTVLEILVARQLLFPTVVPMVLSYCERWQSSHFEAALAIHLVSEYQLRDVLAEEYQLPTIEQIPAVTNVDMMADKLSFREARQQKILALGPSFLSPDEDVFVIANPVSAIEYLKRRNIQFGDLYVASRTMVLASIDQNYPLSGQLQIS